MTATKARLEKIGIPLIITGYSVIIVVSLLTLMLGPTKVVYALSLSPYGGLLSLFVFDSWGTVAGLLGVTVFYFVVVQGTIASRRLEVSLFLLFSTIVIAIIAGLIYDRFFDSDLFNGTRIIASGASTVAVAGMAIAAFLSGISLARLTGTRPWRSARKGRDMALGWSFLYLTVIGFTLYFALVMQPVFVPSSAFNFRAHELAFIMGLFTAMAYVTIRPSGQAWETSLRTRGQNQQPGTFDKPMDCVYPDSGGTQGSLRPPRADLA